MSVFTDAELRYLTGGRQLGRLATVGADGTPHVVPVGWIYNAARDAIEIGGIELERSKKFRDIARTGRAAIVIDDLEATDPWRPRGVEVRGRAEAIALPTPANPDPSRADRQPGGSELAAAHAPSRASRPAATDLHANPPYCVALGQRPPSQHDSIFWRQSWHHQAERTNPSLRRTTARRPPTSPPKDPQGR
jgi:pyridoxamine 5'-phosphate oxidase family protein